MTLGTTIASRVAGIILLAGALLTSGCGGGAVSSESAPAEPAMTATEFRRAADHLCGQALQRLSTANERATQLEQVVQAAGSIRAELLQEMAMLRPPAPMQRSFKALMLTLEARTLTGERYLHKLERGDMNYTRVVTQLNAQMQRAKRLSRSLGLRYCPTY